MDGRHTARSHEVLKPLDSGLDLSNRSAPEMPVKFQSDAIIITSNLVGSVGDSTRYDGKTSYRLVNKNPDTGSRKITRAGSQKGGV